MIFAEVLGNNIWKVTITGSVDEKDFVKVAPQVERIIRAHGALKVLIDATSFNGWSDMQSAKEQFAFARNHQMKVERIALIAGYAWQHWIAGAASVLI